MKVLNENVQRKMLVTQAIQRYSPNPVQRLYTTLSWWETRIGSSVPDYQRKIIQRVEAGSSYERTGVTWNQVGNLVAKVVIIDFPYTPLVSTEYIHDWQIELNQLPSITPVCAAVNSDLDNRALAKFLSNAVDAQRPFMGGVFLGELRQTLRMIRDPFRTMRQLFTRYLTAGVGYQKRVASLQNRIRKAKGNTVRQRQLRKRLSDKLRKEVDSLNKALSDSWLELQLGVEPLVADVENGLDAYSAFSNKFTYVRAYAKVEENVSTSAVDTTVTAQSLWSFHVHRKQSYDRVVKYRGAFKVKIQTTSESDESLAELQRLTGFRLWDFVPTVYNLIPASFVVDYFSNLGNIINGVEALTFEWAWKSRSSKATVRVLTSAEPDVARMRASFGHRPCFPLVDRTLSRHSDIESWAYQRNVPVLTLPALVFHFDLKDEQWGTVAALISKAETFRLTKRRPPSFGGFQ